MADRSSNILLALLLASSLLLVAAPTAGADDAADGLLGEGCAVTPGGWGAPPSGGNPGALLHAHFETVFGGSLTVGGVTFDSAQEVTDTLPVNGDPLLNHAVALTINLAFGNAGLLDGTVAGVTVTSGPYAGSTGPQLLAFASVALADAERSTSKYSALITAMDGFNNEWWGCEEITVPCVPGSPACPTLPCGGPDMPECPTPPCGTPGQPACPPAECPPMNEDVEIIAYESDDGSIWIRFSPPLTTAEERMVLLPGDLLTAILGIAPGCADVTLSLIAYAETDDGFVLFDSDTGTFDAGVHDLEVDLPPCSYLVYLVRGDVAADLGEGNPYGSNLLDWEMGGEGPCVTEEPPCGTPGQPACPVPPCGTPGQPACPVPPCGTPGQPACPTSPVVPPCPANVVASALDEGVIRLTWGGVSGAASYQVYRNAPGETMTLVATVSGTTFEDTDTEVGATYTYMVKSVVGGQASAGCATVTATAIPFFTGAWGVGLAALGAVAVFVVLRRRG